MSEYKRFLVSMLLIWIGVGAVQPAVAGLPLLDLDRAGRFRDRDWVVGYEVTVDRELTITDLGKFDANGNGTLDDLVAPKVGVWDIIGQQLASVTIDDSATFDHGAFYRPIAPITLSPGSYVIGTQMFEGQEPYVMATGFPSSVNSVDFVEGRRKRQRTSDYAFPVDGSRSLLLGPSFKADEPIVVFEPKSTVILQRDEQGLGHVRVQGLVSDQVDRVESRAVVMDGFSGTDTQWQPVSFNQGILEGTVTVPPGGWYRIETKAYEGDKLLGEHSVDQIGIGDVFITAGQSNAANHGSPRLAPQNGLVYAMDAQGTWRPAKDPQPGATGSGGSPWPALGDLLAEELDIPIGLVSVAWGGTSVRQWLPGASGPDANPLYDRLKNALDRVGKDGARAILWHQGEADSLASTSTQRYAERMTELIAQSREDAGFEIPWFVARASYLPSTSSRAEARVVAGQEQVIQDDPLVFAGPLTDDLRGSEWRWDSVHFNEAGLREHAARWAAAIQAATVPEPSNILLAALGLAWLLAFRPRGNWGRVGPTGQPSWAKRQESRYRIWPVQRWAVGWDQRANRVGHRVRNRDTEFGRLN